MLAVSPVSRNCEISRIALISCFLLAASGSLPVAIRRLWRDVQGIGSVRFARLAFLPLLRPAGLMTRALYGVALLPLSVFHNPVDRLGG
jgi:hypothetical protein